MQLGARYTILDTGHWIKTKNDTGFWIKMIDDPVSISIRIHLYPVSSIQHPVSVSVVTLQKG